MIPFLNLPRDHFGSSWIISGPGSFRACGSFRGRGSFRTISVPRGLEMSLQQTKQCHFRVTVSNGSVYSGICLSVDKISSVCLLLVQLKCIIFPSSKIETSLEVYLLFNSSALTIVWTGSYWLWEHANIECAKRESYLRGIENHAKQWNLIWLPRYTATGINSKPRVKK